MKRALAIILGLAVLACQKKDEPNGNLLLTGEIKGLKKGTLYIQKLEDTLLVPVDSIAIDGDSHFTSDMQLDSPQMLYLFLDRGVTTSTDNSLMVFAEPGKIDISTSLETFFADAKITGSKNHELYEEFRKVNSRYTGEELDITAARLNAYKDKKFFDEKAAKDKLDKITKRRYLYAVNFALNHRDKEVAPYIAISEIAGYAVKSARGEDNVRYLDTISKALTPEVSKSKYGQMLIKLINERKIIQEAAPLQ